MSILNFYSYEPDKLKRGTKLNVRYQVDSVESKNSFIPIPGLRPEHGSLFKHQNFLCKDFIGYMFCRT